MNFSTINLKIITGAQHTDICGIMDDGSLKIKLQAKPVEGKANLALIKFLAEQLEISSQAVEIITGFQSRRKVVKVIGLTQDQLDQKIIRIIEHQEP